MCGLSWKTGSPDRDVYVSVIGGIDPLLESESLGFSILRFHLTKLQIFFTNVVKLSFLPPSSYAFSPWRSVTSLFQVGVCTI